MGAGGMPMGSGHGFAIGSLSWCWGSTLSYASGDVHAALWCKSVLMVLVGSRYFIRIHFIRNYLFRVVTLPEPSILTTYWSKWRTSIIVPVLSHLRGCGPVWFRIRTWSPMINCGRRLVCSVQRSAERMWRMRIATSLANMVSCQVLWGLYFPGGIGIKSPMGWLNIHMAGDN